MGQGRKSKYEKFKPEVLAQFQLGKQPKEIFGQFQDVPQSTIRDWHKKFVTDFRGDNSVEFRGNSVAASQPKLEVVPPPPSESRGITRVIPLFSDDDEGDLVLARRILRAIAKDKDTAGGVKVQACLGLVKMVELKTNGRLIEAEEGVNYEHDLEGVSDEELMAKFKDLIMGDAG